ncbi:hypothetical protein BDV27DRAFT_145155 [Aspergillus caelatus]|uniref:Oxidase ustYa n=1 Tax=Aspergillus caelatus TaxID=61420 RepID=A0A5N7A4B0_9EURO|nr:uncharacterized protein BDV27DRAFT_145155 [Aspergillus caelatus]KAE8364652.1 hypothetical protein BDV27DRAFT_145155 [Aspergillus caelatus]
MAEHSSKGYKEVPVRNSEESTIAEEEKEALFLGYRRRQTLYGEPLNPEAEKAWDELMPVGRGFVNINNDTALPDQPGLDQSLPQQRAMISVFHQLHCIYMTREGYYAAREGNLDQVNAAHLMHCWDYLRQAVMCNADTTLEWLPAPPNDRGSTGWGYEHTCRDFDAISRWAEENRFKTTHGIH